MAIPKNIPNIQDVAKGWKSELDLVAARCQKARDNIDTDREHLIVAYQSAQSIVSKSQSLASAGYTAEVIGPVVGTLHGVDWTQYADDWTALRDTLLPSLISAVKSAESDVVRGSLTASGDISISHVMPTESRDAIITTLDAILAKFA